MHKTNFKKVLSVFLSFLMILSCWVWVAPDTHTHAEAAATTYKWRVTVKATKGSSLYKDGNVVLNYITNNGTGSSGSITLSSGTGGSTPWNDNDGVEYSFVSDSSISSVGTALSKSASLPANAFPVSVSAWAKLSGNWFSTPNSKWMIKLEVFDSNGTLISDSSYGNEVQAKSNAGAEVTNTATDTIGTDKYPYVKTLTASPDSVNIEADGSSDVTFSLSAVDNYGVDWVNAPSSVTASNSAKVASANTKNPVVTYNDADADYSSTLSVKYTDANSGTDPTLTKTISVKTTRAMVYDNLIDFSEWAKLTPGNATATFDKATRSITLKSNNGVTEGTFASPFFAVEPGKDYRIDIDVEGEAWDVYIFFCDEAGNWIDFADGPTNRFSAGATTGIPVDNAVFTAPNKAEVVKAQIRIDANNSDNTVKFKDICVRENTFPSATSFSFAQYDSTIESLPYPTETGYTFKGWFDAAGNQVVAPVTASFDGEKHLYSKWEENQYNLFYSPNGGEGSRDGGLVYYTQEVKLAPNDFTAPGYDFIGWNTEADGSGIAIADGATVSKLASGHGDTVVLHAQWAKKTYAITWTFIDGSTKTDYLTMGSAITAPENSTKAPDAAGHYEYVWKNVAANVTGTATYTETLVSYTHNFGAWTTVSEATCTEDGSRQRTCSDCGYVETETVKASHILATAQAQTPTCGAPGWEAYEYCTRCTYTEKVEIPATGNHTYTYVQNADGATHTGTCVCGATTQANCSGGTATCLAPATCSDCGSSYGTELGHSFTNYVYNNDAECEKNGTKTAKCDRCDATNTVEADGTALEHDYTDWTTVTEPTCSAQGSKQRGCKNCDHTETAAIPVNTEAHSWGAFAHDADAQTHTRVCAYNAAHTETVNCSLSGYSITANPTCLEEGSQFRTCTVCHYVYTESISAAGHKFTEATEVVDPTCEGTGMDSYKTCEVCRLFFAPNAADDAADGKGNTDSFIIPAAGHSFTATEADESYLKTPANCTAPAEYFKSCAACGLSSAGIEGKEATFTSGGALGHTNAAAVEENVVKASCAADGSYDSVVYCSVCDAEISRTAQTIAKREHVYGDEWVEVTAPTYTTEGLEKKTCTNAADAHYVACSHEITQAIPVVEDKTAPTGTITYETTTWNKLLEAITFGIYTSKDVELTITAADDESGIKAVEYYISDVALTKDEVIALTDWTEYNKAVTIAKADTATKVVYVKLTNTQNGVAYISSDGFTFDLTAPVISADTSCTSSVITVTETNIASVTVNGAAVELTDGKYTIEGVGTYTIVVIDKAGTVETATVEIAGHTEETLAAKDATCTETGLTEGKKCTVCDEILVAQNTIPAKGHTFGNNVAYKAATCIAKGNEAYKSCSECNKFFAADAENNATDGKDDASSFVIGALGHDYDEEFTVDVKASCEAAGSKSKHCSRCEATTDVTVIPVREHVMVNDVVVNDATCTVDGVQPRYCSNTVTDEYEACAHTDTVVIPAKGHTEEILNAKDATCTTTGLTEGKKCTVCGTVTVAQETIDALKHSYNAVVTDPTCLAQGYTTYTCVRGDHTYVADYTDALDHDYDDENVISNGDGTHTVVCTRCDADTDGHTDIVLCDYAAEETAPTCTVAGYTTYTCNDCGYSYKVDGETAKGHTMGAWKSNNNGTHTRVCTVCINEENRTETEECIYGEWVETMAPTCTAAGSKQGKCSVCDHEVTVEVDALGHSFTNYEANDNATCTEDGTKTAKCDRCDATDEVVNTGSAKGHDWADAECDKPSTCNVCGITSGSAIGHDYSVVIATVDYTCTTDGYTTYKCSRCDSTEDSDIVPAAHRFAAEYTVDAKASCKAAGSKSRHCSECGAKTDVTVIPAREHNLIDTTVAQAATCMAEGIMNQKCSNTATDEYLACEHVTTRVIPVDKNAHKWETEYTVDLKATCTASGKKSIHCEYCDKSKDNSTVVIEKRTHKFEDVEVDQDATCTADGVMITRCKNIVTAEYEACSATSTRAISATGHTFGDVTSAKAATCTDTGYDAYKQCSKCSKFFAAAAETNSTDAKDSAAAFITPALEHNFATTFTVDKKATCTEAGSKSRHCSRCEAKTEVTVIPAREHALVDTTEATAATCLTAGTMNQECSNEASAEYEACEYTTTRVIPAKGHTFGEITAANAATCTDAGNEAYKSCTVCHKYFAADAEANDATGADNANGFVIGALDHDFAADFTVDTKATCGTAGSKSKHCSRCEATTDVTEIPAREHALVDTTVATAATCLTAGTMNQECSNEASAEYEACEYTTTRVIPAKGHNFSAVVAANAATCEDAGNNAYKTCTVCNKFFAENAEANDATGADNANGFVIGALGHDFAADFTVDTKATCGTAGSKSKHCSRCEAKTEVTEIPAREHALVDTTVATAATCLTAGTMNQECSNEASAEYEACEYTTTRVIPAKGHTFGEITAANAATCTDAGNEAYKSCTVCKKYFAADAEKNSADAENSAAAFITPALDHNFATTFTVDKKATCTEAGSKSRHCSRCEAKTEVTVIPAREHALVDSTVATAATCLTAGTMNQECSNEASAEYEACEYTTTRVISAKGHTFSAVVAANAATCLDAGNNAYKTCTVCNKYFAADAEANDATGADNANGFVIDALDHDYDEEFTVDVKASCVAAGSKSKHCSRCEATTEITVIPAREHILADTTTALAATCATKGIMNQICSNEATDEYEACAYTTTREIDYDAGNHENVVTDVAVAPQCEATGLTAGSHCTACNTVVSAQDIIPATGHTEVIDVAVAAGCSTTGLTEGKHCTVCNKVTVAQTVIPAAGHSEVIDKAVAPGCETTGLTEGKHCSRCGTVITAQSTVAATGHNFDKTKSYLTRPTQKANGTWTDGYYTYYCTNDKSHSTTETVKRADYTMYNAVIESVNSLLKEELPAEDVAKLEELLNNTIALNLIAGEQSQVDAEVEKINDVITAVYPDAGLTLVIRGADTFYAGTVVDLSVFKVNENVSIEATNVTWTCSEENVVVYANGRLLALGTGTVTLTATSGLLTATKTISIVEGGNVRVIRFNAMNQMHYIIEDSFAVYNTGNLYWTNNDSIRFRVYTYSGFGYETHMVYINGVAVEPDAEGYYTIPAGIGDARINVAGAVYEEDDEGNRNKFNFWEWLVALFRKIINFFKSIFGVA